MNILKKVKKFVDASSIVYENNEKRKDLVKSKLPTYNIDTELSNKNNLVLVNNRSKKIIVAFRGTLLTANTKFKDIGSDILITLGLTFFSSRERNSVKLIKNIKKKYKDYEIKITGHSLGGNLAYKVAKKLKLPAITFNAPDKAKLRLTRKHDETSNRKLLTIKTDPIGLLGWKSLSGNHILLDAKVPSNPHGLINFEA